MQRIASALLLGGGVLLTTWVVSPASPASPQAPARPAPQTVRDQQPAPPVLPELAAQAERLRFRLANRPEYLAPQRDPFRFGQRHDAPKPKDSGANPASPPIVREAAPAPVLPRLIAIMSATVDGVPVRTASLAVGDDVLVVKAGDLVASYLVKSVAADVIELFDPATGATFRLSLR